MSLIVAVLGGIALRGEFQVAQAQALLVADMQHPVETFGSARPVDDGLPPRAQVVEALRLAGAAANDRDPARRLATLDAADRALRSASAHRPGWGDVAIAQAYVAAQRSGTTSPRTIAALAASYAATPFVRDAAGWRIATGLANWDRLDARTRHRVIDEAVWLSQTSYRAMVGIAGLLRGTPAYEPFMLRWRALRMSDLTY